MGDRQRPVEQWGILPRRICGIDETLGLYPDSELTAREREVLAELATDTTYDQIATALGVSINTVRTHIRAVYDKLAVSSRTAAVMQGVSRGLIKV
jgi:DNA-binding CsgD family transcriptional regulator